VKILLFIPPAKHYCDRTHVRPFVRDTRRNLSKSKSLFLMTFGTDI